MRRLSYAAFVLLAGLVPAQAQESVVPESAAQVKLSFAPVVKSVTAAVVNVYAQHVEKAQANPMFNDPFFRQFFGGGAAPRERVERSLGSGVIVAKDGMIVTNYHVIANATQVRVALSDKREFDADIILKDQRADLAVLRLKGVKADLATLDFADSDKVQVGDLVLAVGDPFGVGQTVTSGIVSALARSQVGQSDFQSFIQTDAAINPGNSGGALVDLNGRLVGINTAIVSRSGGNIGIGFAIPAAMVKVVVASAQAGSDRVLRPWIGASMQSVSSEIAESLSMERPAGALVTEVAKNGPAAQGGLQTGDVVLAVDGIAVSDPDEFGYRFATKPLGGEAQLEVLRKGERLKVSVKLAAAPESTPRDDTVLQGRSPLSGATVANLSPATAETLGMPLDTNGVVITNVEDDSAAANFGFQKKDVIQVINGQKVDDAKALDALVQEPRRLWRITIVRDGQQISTILGG
ncbi:Do family serine endopeptidase [Labrys sp. La1]|uniref:Do family serine endopeptidase n=1 Tax=Labrys sp. La1 TaxID=3404917 RepID=UPI003EBA187F